MEKFQNIPLQKRTTIHSAASAMNISSSLLYRNYRVYRKIKRRSSTLKPFLTYENKKARLQFCLSMLEEESLPHDPIFKDMYNVIHTDEKWFNLSNKDEKFYLFRMKRSPVERVKIKILL